MKDLPVFPNARKWSTKLNVEIDTVDLTNILEASTGLGPNIKILTKNTHIFDANL